MIGPSWAPNDAPSKDLSNTRALQHLAPLATDYWAPSHVSSNSAFSVWLEFLKNSQCFRISGRENAVGARGGGHGSGRASVGL